MSGSWRLSTIPGFREGFKLFQTFSVPVCLAGTKCQLDPLTHLVSCLDFVNRAWINFVLPNLGRLEISRLFAQSKSKPAVKTNFVFLKVSKKKAKGFLSLRYSDLGQPDPGHILRCLRITVHGAAFLGSLVCFTGSPQSPVCLHSYF